MTDVDQLHRALQEAAALRGPRALIRVTATYQPAGGEGSKVFPPTFPTRDGGSPYLFEPRRVNGEDRQCVVLDQVPSQANRAEEALLRAFRAGRIRLPLMELHHTGDASLVLTSLEFPHRYADAYLRDSLLDGTPFDRTDVGRSFQAASLDDATALYTRDPGSLIYGAWNSHRKGRQQKFPRSYASEIIGWDPATGKRSAGRMDPVNLVGAAQRGAAADQWTYQAVGIKTKGERLSEIGHGNVAPNPAHGGVTISSAQRMATISMAALDRIGFGTAPHDAAVAARAALAAYALLGDRLAFGGASVWLRSNCELVPQSETLEWVLRDGRAAEPFELSASEALDLYGLALQHAEKQGLPMELDTVRLTPSASLAKAIDFSLTKATGAGE
jgi:CRISPR-associated protein Csb1